MNLLNEKKTKRKTKKYYEHPSYIGYANEMPEDNRQKIWKRQYNERGFDSTQLWNLDTTIIKFITPRLKEFKFHFDKQIEDKKLSKTLSFIIKEFEFYLSDEYNDLNEEHIKNIKKALNLLSKNLFSLWL